MLSSSRINLAVLVEHASFQNCIVVRHAIPSPRRGKVCAGPMGRDLWLTRGRARQSPLIGSKAPRHALVSAASSLGVLNGICVVTIHLRLYHIELTGPRFVVGLFLRNASFSLPDNELLASRKHLIYLIACSYPIPGKCGV